MTFHDKISPHAFPCFSMTVGTLHVRYCDSCLEAGGIARSTAEKWKALLETHTSEDRSDMVGKQTDELSNIFKEKYGKAEFFVHVDRSIRERTDEWRWRCDAGGKQERTRENTFSYCMRGVS